MESPRPIVISKTYGNGELQNAVVLFQGNYYEVNSEYLLDLVISGHDLEELGLEPLEVEESEYEEFDGDYCHSDHFSELLRKRNDY